MSCLLPQFKCLPDSFSINFKTHTPTQLSKGRDPISFRGQCILSTTSIETTVLSIENLQLQSLDLHSDLAGSNSAWSPSDTGMLDWKNMQLPTLKSRSNSILSSRPWTHATETGPSIEGDIGTKLPSEFVTSEEAVIEAAASEAVALARAAAKIAKSTLSLFEVKSSEVSRLQDYQIHQKGQTSGQNKLLEDASLLENMMRRTVYVEPTDEDIELLETQLSGAVRSRRQTERKARRERAAEKVAACVVSVKSSSSRWKKRGSVREINYSDPLYYLRKTTGSSRLLSAKEEQELSVGIQDLLKLERLYEDLSERYGGPPSFMQWAVAADVDQRTLRRRINYGTFCKDKMIKSNIRLVISVVKFYLGSGLNIQDLVQEGCRGLVRGAEKFDAMKGFKFSTYAHWWIKQAVRKSLSDQSRTIRLPFHMVQAAYKVREVGKQFYIEHRRSPTNQEITNKTGLPLKRVEAVELIPKTPSSLDQKIGIDKDMKLSDIIKDPEAETLDEVLTKQLLRQDLDKVMNTLNPRERQVVRWRYGLEDGRMKTLQEIGELMDVSRERIRQIEACAFQKLKNKKRTQVLQQYMVDS